MRPKVFKLATKRIQHGWQQSCTPLCWPASPLPRWRHEHWEEKGAQFFPHLALILVRLSAWTSCSWSSSYSEWEWSSEASSTIFPSSSLYLTQVHLSLEDKSLTRSQRSSVMVILYHLQAIHSVHSYPFRVFPHAYLDTPLQQSKALVLLTYPADTENRQIFSSLQSFTYLKASTISSLDETTLLPQSFILGCVLEISERKTEWSEVFYWLHKYLKAEGNPAPRIGRFSA